MIKETAEEVAQLHQVDPSVCDTGHEEVPIPIPSGRRPSKEITDIYEALNKGRRHTLARQTSTVNEILNRSSFDLNECEERMTPRSRRGSLFPASEFIDDFAGANRGRNLSVSSKKFSADSAENAVICEEQETSKTDD